MDVWILQYGSDIQGVFESEGLAHERIVRDALQGVAIIQAEVNKYAVSGRWTNPLDNFKVRDAIQAGKKIAAIKAHREDNYGMGLLEAKEAIEAVYDKIPKDEEEDDLPF